MMTNEELVDELLPCPFCGKAVEDRPNPGYAALAYHPVYGGYCPLSGKVFVAAAWNIRAPEQSRDAVPWEELAVLHGQQVRVTFKETSDAFALFSELNARALSPTPSPITGDDGEAGK